MTDLRRAAEMALEAFEVLDRRGGLGLDVHEYLRTKIDALRQALAHEESEVTRLRQVCRNVYEVWAGSEGIPMPETCAEGYLLQLVEQMRDEAKEGLHVDAVNMSQERVDETAKREHEPVAWMWKDGTITNDPDKADGTWQPLYMAPPKREWVGLTDDDKQEAFDETQEASGGFWEFAEYLEAKLKEKNCG